jgi:hypothetical protein
VWTLGDPVTDVLAALLVLLAGQVVRTHLRARRAGVVGEEAMAVAEDAFAAAELAERLATSAHVRLDLHSEVLPVVENSRNTKVSSEPADLPSATKAAVEVTRNV